MRPRLKPDRIAAALRTALAAPKIVVGALLLAAIAVMLAGVFLRYVMVRVTNWLGLAPISFFWVEEVGEMLLAWLTLVGAAVGIAERTHFSVNLVVQHLPPAVQRAVHACNHLAIAVFGGVLAWEGWQVAALNTGLTSPALGISMGWLYAALVTGGILIALFALATIFVAPTAQHDVVE